MKSEKFMACPRKTTVSGTYHFEKQKLKMSQQSQEHRLQSFPSVRSHF